MVIFVVVFFFDAKLRAAAAAEEETKNAGDGSGGGGCAPAAAAAAAVAAGADVCFSVAFASQIVVTYLEVFYDNALFLMLPGIHIIFYRRARLKCRVGQAWPINPCYYCTYVRTCMYVRQPRCWLL